MVKEGEVVEVGVESVPLVLSLIHRYIPRREEGDNAARRWKFTKGWENSDGGARNVLINIQRDEWSRTGSSLFINFLQVFFKLPPTSLVETKKGILMSRRGIFLLFLLFESKFISYLISAILEKILQIGSRTCCFTWERNFHCLL